MSDLSIRPEQAPKPYMTVIPTRSPRQKLHGTIGQAKAAATTPGYIYAPRDCAKKDVAIYEWNSATEQWDLLYELRAGDQLPWRKK